MGQEPKVGERVRFRVLVVQDNFCHQGEVETVSESPGSQPLYVVREGSWLFSLPRSEIKVQGSINS